MAALSDQDAARAAELADGTLSGPEWDAWLAERPEVAAEVRLARQVRALIAELRAAEVELPPGFEARLMARVREDAAVRDLLDLGVGGLGQVLLELLRLLLGLIPTPRPAPAV